MPLVIVATNGMLNLEQDTTNLKVVNVWLLQLKRGTWQQGSHLTKRGADSLKAGRNLPAVFVLISKALRPRKAAHANRWAARAKELKCQNKEYIGFSGIAQVSTLAIIIQMRPDW